MSEKYGIVYSSETGNTKKLAIYLSQLLSSSAKLYYEIPDYVPKHSILFLGFGIDKGTCSVELQEFMQRLHHQTIILFGTCGFSNEVRYHNLLIDNISKNLAADNTVLDYFMCQGEISIQFKEKYEKALLLNPDDPKMLASLKIYQESIGHPNSEDMDHFREFVFQNI